MTEQQLFPNDMTHCYFIRNLLLIVFAFIFAIYSQLLTDCHYNNKKQNTTTCPGADPAGGDGYWVGGGGGAIRDKIFSGVGQGGGSKMGDVPPRKAAEISNFQTQFVRFGVYFLPGYHLNLNF